MSKYLTRLISLILSFSLILEQGVFAQGLDLSGYFANPIKSVLQNDKFRPQHLRYISYDSRTGNFKLLLDKGYFLKGSPSHQATRSQEKEDKIIQETTQELMRYFFIGLSLPNDKFWVNLRPDSPDNIIDDSLARTDIGKIMLETDLQLKKDTAQSTSPNTPQGKAYWDKLYQKAEELYGSANITIPTLTRPWIVPGEIIIGETQDSAYVYKATLKVMLEEDYLSRGRSRTAPTMRTAPTPDQYAFSDPRLKELNQYSTQLIKETIIPKLTYEVNTSKRYAPLRQVYYSLILAQWFKDRYRSQRTEDRGQGTEKANSYLSLIDSGNLANLTSNQPYDKLAYFKQYQESFAQGEYNLQEPRYTPSGQSIRSYFSGGEKLNIRIPSPGTNQAGSTTIIPSKTLLSSPTETEWMATPSTTAASGLINTGLSPDAIKELAKTLAKMFNLPPLFDYPTEFPISGKKFKLFRNKNRTIYTLGPLVLLPLVDSESDEIKKLEEEFDAKNNNILLYPAAIKERIAALVKRLEESYLKGNPNILLVPPFSAVPAHPVNPFSAFMIAAMLAWAEDFKDATVIDAGSGAGLLALIALKLGAKKVILIESNKTEKGLAKIILEAQEYEEGKHFTILNTDLNNTKKLKKELKDLGISQERIIGLANIGPWPHYKNANYMAIEFFIELGVDRIINGGYSFNFDNLNDKKNHIDESDNIYKLLMAYGYNTQKFIPNGYCIIKAAKELPLEIKKKSAEAEPISQEKSSSAVTNDSSVRAYEKFFKDYFLVPRTTQKVLNSLGNFEKELIINEIGKFECINFNLNEDGKSSLRELLDLESVDAKAHLLYKRTADKNLKRSVEMAGILFKEPDRNKIFFLNITDLSIGYNKQNSFYDEGINPDCSRMAYTASLQLFPEINNAEIRVIRLKREALTRYLSGPYDTYFTSPFELEMLVLEDETGKDLNFIFFPSDPFSQDFQISLHGLHKKNRLFQSKRIVEIGAGTGVNNLLGLKFGAKTIKAIDTSRLYVLLARWNIEFTKETGQVEETSAEQVEINPGNSFNSISSIDADIYLFNSPSIRGKEEIDKYSKGEKTLKTIGNFMLTDDFMALFEQQKEILLSNPNAVAIWRIFPSEDSGLKKVNEAELTEFEGPRIKARDRTLLESKAMGKKFLKESGLAFTELSPTIYMLYSPSAKLSGSPFIPNTEKDTEKEPVKPNPSSGFGGIDFRNLPIVTQARNNLSANIAGSAIAGLKDTDLNQEWLDIQNLTRAGISPSPERIKEYLQGLCLKNDYSGEKARNVILCLADILRLEEENYLATDALLKDILIILSSTNDTPGLEEAFLGKAVK